MNILIENDETLEYFTADGVWSKDAANGRRFANTSTAFTMAKQQFVQKFNIVSYIPLTKQFVNLDHGRGKAASTAAAAPATEQSTPA